MYINDKQRICIWLNNQCSKMQYKPGQRQQGLDFNWDKDNEKQMHTGYNFEGYEVLTAKFITFGAKMQHML